MIISPTFGICAQGAMYNILRYAHHHHHHRHHHHQHVPHCHQYHHRHYHHGDGTVETEDAITLASQASRRDCVLTERLSTRHIASILFIFSIDNSTVEQSYGKCTVEKIHRMPHYIHSLNFYSSSSHIITLSVQVCFDSQQLIISSLFRFSEKLMLLNF